MRVRRTPGIARIVAVLLVALGAVVFSAMVSHGRVFMRWRRGSDVMRAFESAGATRVYRTQLLSRKGRSEFLVFGMDESAPRTAALMRRVLPEIDLRFEGGRMAVGRGQAGGQPASTVLLDLGIPDRSLVFVARQEPQPGFFPEIPVPSYPQAERLFEVHDPETRATLTVEQTDAAPQSVLYFYASRMEEQGWSEAVRLRGDTAVFLRELEVCCVQASSTEPGRTRISMLHKSSALK